MRTSLTGFLILAAAVTSIWLGGTSSARAEASAFTDVEVDLEIVSVTPGATLNFVGSGSSQVDLGPIPAAIGNSFFNQVRIAGTLPANGVDVPMSVGHILEFDAQAHVVTDPLVTGRATYNRIDHDGLLEFENAGGTDATITFDFEREHRLNTFLDDALTEFARAHKTFSLSAFTFDATGGAVDSFPLLVDFDQEVEQGATSSVPEDHFNFSLFVPAGGNGYITMQAMAFSEVALVPEPSSVVLAFIAFTGLAAAARRRHT